MFITKHALADLANASDAMLDARIAQLNLVARCAKASPLSILCVALLLGMPVILFSFAELEARFYASCGLVFFTSVVGFGSIDFRKQIENKLKCLTRLSPVDGDYCERSLLLTQSSPGAKAWVSNALAAKRHLRYFDFDKIVQLHALDMKELAAAKSVLAYHELHAQTDHGQHSL